MALHVQLGKQYLGSDTWVEGIDGDIVLTVEQDQYLLDRIPLTPQMIPGLIAYIQDILLLQEKAGEGQKIEDKTEN